MKTIHTIIYFLHSFLQLFLFSCAVLCMTSCDSFVEVDLPKSQLTNGTVFEDYATASAALTDIYSKIRDKGLLTGTSSGISNRLGNYTDEMNSFGTPKNPTLDFFNNTLLPSTPAIAEYWNAAYNQLYATNALIEGVQASLALSAEDKKKLLAEAYFIRALLHFYLVNLFGDIPYITQTDYKSNSMAARMSTDTVYDHIITDLENAIHLLPENYNNKARVQPNQFTAKALLARVYLYQGAWAEAGNAASAVINHTSLYLFEENIARVFLNDTKETIWQLQAAKSGKNTDEAATFIFFSGPPPLVALSTNLVNSFPAGDLRKTNWIKKISSASTSWYHPYKYKETNFTPASKEYSIVFRLTEQYLIRAEARTQQGDLIGAKEDLNKIRHRAGLGDTSAITQQEILEAILQERRWEFFTEYGHRFFDLKRSGQINTVLSNLKLGWNSSDALFPIPQTELSANPNLRPQNPGY
jgi:hypothetical protein